MLRRRAIFAFPPYIAVIGEGDIGVKRIVRHRFHRVRIRFVIRSRDDAEVAVLGIDREQTTIADLHPGDVVAHGRHFPAGKMFRRNQHGEICFAAGTRERGRHVMLFPLGRFDSEDQHVLGHPTLFTGEIGTDPEGETFFA